MIVIGRHHKSNDTMRPEGGSGSCAQEGTGKGGTDCVIFRSGDSMGRNIPHHSDCWKTHREGSERSPRLCSRRDGLTAIFLGYRNNNKNTMQLYTQNMRLKIGFKNMQMFSQNNVS